MAIYHLSVKPISRAGGRSATAAVAYRSGELVHDLTSGETFDYTRRRGVEHTEIVLPTEAARRDINWARDRSALWNAAEAAENRSNSRVAREYELALPHELDAGRRLDLVRAFSKDIADRYGVAVDFAIHAPHRNGDDRNHHAHVLTTTRVIEAGGLGEKSEIEWSDGNRRKAGLGAAKEEISLIRERWAGLTNEHLQSFGIKVRVDHRSLETQGIERAATSHLGPAVSGMERRGIETRVGKRLEAERIQAVQQKLENTAEMVAIKQEQQALRVSIFELSAMAPQQRERKAKSPEQADNTPSRPTEAARESTRSPGRERGTERSGQSNIFAGLTLGGGDNPSLRGAFAGLSLGSEETAERPVPSRAPTVNAALERYAKAWLAAEQMRPQGFEVLEHQKVALAQAGAALEAARPGAVRDLGAALRHEPSVGQALTTFSGERRTQALLAALVLEERLRLNPEARAERLVKTWQQLETQHRGLGGSAQKEQRGLVEAQLKGLVREIKGDKDLQHVLEQGRGRGLGLQIGQRLQRVVQERDLERAMHLLTLS